MTISDKDFAEIIGSLNAGAQPHVPAPAPEEGRVLNTACAPDVHVPPARVTADVRSDSTGDLLPALPASRGVGTAKALYSHEAMVDLMIEHPEYTHAQFAQHFGRTASWFSAVLASGAFQEVLEPKRHLILDPAIAATMDERFRALAIRSSTVLQQKLDSVGVADATVLKAVELGIKALGLGVKAPELPALPPPDAMTPAEKILAAMDARDAKLAEQRDAARTVDVPAREVKDVE